MVAEIVSPPTLIPTLVKPSSQAIDLSVRCQVFHRFSLGGFHLVVIVQTATKCRRDSADLLNWMLLFCLGMKFKAGVENYSRIIFIVLDFYRIADWFVDTFVSLFSFHLSFFSRYSINSQYSHSFVENVNCAIFVKGPSYQKSMRCHIFQLNIPLRYKLWTYATIKSKKTTKTTNNRLSMARFVFLHLSKESTVALCGK